MGLQDFIVTPIYLFLFYVTAFTLRKKLTTVFTRRYFIPSLTIKFFGAISLGFIYQFYYSGGDTFNYWTYGSSHIWNAFLESPINAFKMIFSTSIVPEHWKHYHRLWFVNSDSASYLIKVIGFFDLFTLHTYSATALFFALISFSGSWALFSILSRKYRGNEKKLFIILFLVPSVALWGSGIMKDTLTMGALFWILWAFIRWFEQKSTGLKEILIFVIFFYISYKVKLYVLISLIPCLMAYVVLLNIKKLRSFTMKILVAPVLTVVFVVFGYFSVLKLGEANERYQLQNIAHWSSVTANDLRYWTGKEAGSGYSLGNHDGTWQGMIRLAPGGIFAALFRPFIWESSSILMLLNAMESMVMLIVSINALVKGRFKTVKNDSFLTFCLIFSIIFAFAVGVSTFNFGSLSRYRIPLIPLFLMAMLINPYLNKMSSTLKPSN